MTISVKTAELPEDDELQLARNRVPETATENRPRSYGQ